LRNCIFALLVIVLAWPQSAAGQVQMLPCPPGFRPYGTWCVMGEPPDHLKCQQEIGADPQVRAGYCTSAIDSKKHVGEELAKLLSERAEIRDGQGDFARAIADYSEAIRVLRSAEPLPTTLELYWALRSRGGVYEETGDDALALADYSEMVKLDPKFSSGWWRRGKLYAKKNDCRRALPDYDKAIAVQTEETAELYFDRALCHATMNDPKRALADCRGAQRVQMVLSFRNIWESCDAVIELKLKQFARAVAGFEGHVKAHPDDAYALYGRGIAKLNRGDRAGGAADIAAAKAMDTSVAASFARIGIAE
jgi:tetratricopeptide (TPR) repeat protein